MFHVLTKLGRSLGLVVIVILALAAATSSIGRASSTAEGVSSSAVAPDHRCSSGKHAVIGGKHKCLIAGRTCERRYDGQYHRYGFHCHNGRLARRAAAPKKAKVTLDLNTLAFGDQVTGRTSAIKYLIVTNTGRAQLRVGTVAVAGANASDFRISGCTGAVLSAGSACPISVTFVPGALGPRLADLQIPSNAPGSPHRVVLTGNGVAPASITAVGDSTSPPFRDCHHMSTRATLQPGFSPPVVIATTHIWSDCDFGGFTGTAGVIIADANGGTLDAVSSGESWGVNGKFEANFDSPNDRTVSWEAVVNHPERLPLASSITVVNTWAPRNRLLDIFNKAIATGQTVVQVVATIAALIP